MIRTLVADDDSLVRLALTDILGEAPGITVVAEAADGAEAVALARAHRIDVALMDIRMPRLDGIAATERLRGLPQPPEVVVLTTFDLDQYVYDALTAGASGFLLKDSDPAEIIRAVRVVAEGQAMLHPTAARRLIDRYHHATRATPQAHSRIERLTPARPRCWPSSPTAPPTRRSRARCRCARARSRPTSAGFWRRWRWATGCRRRCVRGMRGWWGEGSGKGRAPEPGWFRGTAPHVLRVITAPW